MDPDSGNTTLLRCPRACRFSAGEQIGDVKVVIGCEREAYTVIVAAQAISITTRRGADIRSRSIPALHSRSYLACGETGAGAGAGGEGDGVTGRGAVYSVVRDAFCV